MTREHIDDLYRVAGHEAQRRHVRDWPSCSADELQGIAVEAGVRAYPTWNPAGGAWGGFVRVVIQRTIIDHLRAHGPVAKDGSRRPYTDSLYDPLHPGEDRCLLDRIAASCPADVPSAAEVTGPSSASSAGPQLVALDTNGYGTLYRCLETGRTVRTRLPGGVLRRAMDRYTSVPYPSAPDVAASLSIPARTLDRALRSLGLHRTRSQAAILRWQAHHGEPLDPDADPTREAIRLLAHVDRAEDVGRIRRRSLSNVWYHRAASRRRRRAFRLAQPVTELSHRDRQIVHAAARGHTGRDLARRFDLTQARISQITSPFRPCD